MKNRDYSYDWLRAFSAIMIVLCHICQGFGISSTLGYYLGGTYVSVFLILSAYLLGIKHRERIACNPGLFLKTRMKRIIPTYYTYLTLAFVIIVMFGLGHLEMRQAIGHYLFLNWFIPSIRIDHQPLPQLGHLWFMSCIVAAYLILTISAILRISQRGKKFWIYLTIVTSLACTILCSVSRYFIYPSVVASLFPLVFVVGDDLFQYMHRRVSKYVVIGLLLLSNTGSIVGYHYGLYGYPPLVFWSITINSLLWIAATPLIFSRNYIPNGIAFVSSISFEIYLIHHPFCLGCYSFAKYMPIGLAIVSVYAVSILLAYFLHSLVNLTMRCLEDILPPPAFKEEIVFQNVFSIRSDNYNVKLLMARMY